jgi:hypothetical protein
VAGAQALEIFFNKSAAYKITEHYIQQKKQHPYPSFYFEIERYENHQEKIQGNPNGWLADKWKKNIKK